MARRQPRPGRTEDRSGTGGAQDRAVYIISVAAELAGVHPQTLRIYERKGLLTPARTPGNNRRYSERDIQRLRTIQRLTQAQGINLAGVKMIVEMEDQLDRMRRRMERLDRELEASVRRAKAELDRLHERHPRADIVTVSSVRPIRHAARQVGVRANVRPHDPARGPIEAGPGS
jgi:MerR family transcriptional regulator, heat shock protein HspR